MSNTREEKQVRRMIKNLRNMNTWQRIMVMDWLQDWYAYVKECEEE